MATVFIFVLGSATGDAATVSLTRRLGRKGGDVEQQLRDTVQRATDIAMEFPRLRARFETNATGVDYNAAPDHTFEFGLATILDGLEGHLRRRRTSSTLAQGPTAR